MKACWEKKNIKKIKRERERETGRAQRSELTLQPLLKVFPLFSKCWEKIDKSGFNGNITGMTPLSCQLYQDVC